MKKTNIRINNFFIFETKDEYYLSSITEINKWREIEKDTFDNYKEEQVSGRLKGLMKQYDIYANVNFYDSKEEGVKRIEIKQKGGT